MIEVAGQAAQLDAMRQALARLNVPVHVIHGDADDFAPIEVAKALVRETQSRRPMRFERVAGANHFMNEGPVGPLLAVLEACIPPRPAWRWPALPKLKLPPLDLSKLAWSPPARTVRSA